MGTATEDRLDRIELIIEEIVQTQQRTEKRMDALAEAQQRTEKRMESLAEAQQRTEKQMDALAEAQQRTEESINRLTEAQQRSEEKITILANEHNEFKRIFNSQIGALGARWGMQTEASFRHAMQGILKDLGLIVERYLEIDTEGMVFGHPDQVELDVVVRNGTIILIEIKSSMNKSDVYTFDKKIQFYKNREGKTVNRRLVVSPFVEPNAMEVANKLRIEVFTDINLVS